MRNLSVEHDRDKVSSDSFGDVRWSFLAALIVFAAYQMIWNLPFRGLFDWLDSRFPDTDPLAVHEYASLATSAAIKFLVAGLVVVLILTSKTSTRAIGLQIRWLGSWTHWLLPLLWTGLIVIDLYVVLSQETPRSSSRPDEPLITRTMLLTTMFLRQLLNPLSEELIFRSFLYLTLRKRLRITYAVLLSALVFGAIHYNGGIHQQVVAFFLGLGLTVVYERMQSLAQSFFLHSSLNLCRFFLALSRGHL